ncbi:hypothetical protein BWQ96_03432 [Gracilariopsis chorda]|uniref:PKD/REJ-like domain-containing protein n=1 Tax=Gracilariopsis chorda TaxID=448386 RepID=A0A2V3IXA2_9FLOR|nr:hypothetical protein BWQ96_03432 [Gracilariopsis chorda]|eukprot:PXF46741.1 hypothetical protein BWQ96_03432 [Gracilariopsis chorda]
MTIILAFFEFLLLLSLSAGVPTGTDDAFLLRREDPSERTAQFSRGRQALSLDNTRAGFSPLTFERREVLMTNGTADDSFVISFVMERASNFSGYQFRFLSNNTEILDPETDISTSQTVTESYANLTSVVDFRRFPGLVQLTVEARRMDGSLFDSLQLHFLAAGMVLYMGETRRIVTGLGTSFVIDDYALIDAQPLRDLRVFVQYLNGSDSNEFPTTSLSSPSDFSLEDIRVRLSKFEGQLLWDPAACSAVGGSWNGSAMSLAPGCGMGFSMGILNNSSYDGAHFAFKFEKNRAGDFLVLFSWDKFTLRSDFDDELFATYVHVVISGQPPCVIRRIEPGNPYSRDGGEELYIEVTNSADVNITSFNVNDVPFPIIAGSHQIIRSEDDFYETAKFLTKAGTGKRLPWTISATRTTGNGSDHERVTFIDDTGFLFSYDDQQLVILSIFPERVPETGDVEVILYGNFSVFSPTAENHNVVVGSHKISTASLVSVTPTEIRFIAPPRVLVGLAWKYGVLLQIGSSFSNRVHLYYYGVTMQLTGRVYGASQDSGSGMYSLNSCGITTFVVSVAERNEEDILFEWIIVDSNGQSTPFRNSSLLVIDRNTLKLANSMLPGYDTGFSIIVTATQGDQVANFTFPVKKSRGFVIGVTLVEPESRAISRPAVDLRIISKVDIPTCSSGRTESLLYEWLYEDKHETIRQAKTEGMLNPDVFNASLAPVFNRYLFSFANDTGTSTTSITPTRLGRELIVPMQFLTYGLHRIRLTVRSANMTVLGRAATTVRILVAPLIALIGTGEVSREVSDTEDLQMYATGSYDPDISLNASVSSQDLQYIWSCSFSLYPNMTQQTSCDQDLLPFKNESNFTVPSSFLRSKRALSRTSFGGRVFLEYKLIVRKGSRTGTTVQRISIVDSEGLRMSRYERIEVTNSRGAAVDLNAVEFWEEIVIRPVASSITQWRFRLEQPIWERATFIAGNNKLITNPGYYTASGSSDPGYQTLPLGILAGKLTPGLKYVFAISFQEAGRFTSEAVISMNTVEVPDIYFSPIAHNNGSTSSVFRAHASTSFKTNSSFAYQFYLISLNGNMREYCVDGCTGANTVKFQIPRAGRYVLQCRLIAANGKTLVAVRNNTRQLFVSEQTLSGNITVYDNETEQDFLWGDDGAVNQRGFFVSQLLYEQAHQVVALSEDSVDETCLRYVKKWAEKSTIILQNERPNTPNTRNYVNLAANYARLTCVEDEETLYKLLTIVDLSLARTPERELLTMIPYSEARNIPNTALEEDLVRFYNFSMTRALSHISTGSSRQRLVPISGEVSNIVLDLSEMWMKHLTASATSGRLCGWEAVYTSDAVGGESDQTLISAPAVYPLGLSTIRVAVRCSAEQGKSLSTSSSSFEWCDAVYDITQSERKLFTLAETFDYPYLSGIQGNNRSETTRVVLVDITTLGEANQLVSALSDYQVAAQTGEREEGDHTCYKIGMTMKSEVAAKVDACSENVPYRMWPRKTYREILEAPFQRSAYQRRTTGVVSTAETRNESRIVVAQSNTLGLYGAYRSLCQEQGQGLGGFASNLTGMVIGILLIALLIIFITYSLAVLVVAATARNTEGDAEAEFFVERDTYGRGDVLINTRLASVDSVATSAPVHSSHVSNPIPSLRPNLQGENAT